MQVVRDGVIWLDDWVDPLEGAYTRLGKLFSVNIVSRSWLVSTIFGRDPHEGGCRSEFQRWSCLDTSWAGKKEGFAGKSLAEAIIPPGLEEMFGARVHEFASDKHFRYCPTCLDDGFQSVLCQIDGLLRCPVHDIALIAHCRACGRQTGPYAMEIGLVRNPLICGGCGEPLSSAWKEGAAVRWPLRKVDSPYRKYGELAQLFSRFRGVKYISTASWDMYFEAFTENERRSANLALSLAAIGVTVDGADATIPTCLPSPASVALTRSLRIAGVRTNTEIDMRRIAKIWCPIESRMLASLANSLEVPVDAWNREVWAYNRATSLVDEAAFREDRMVQWAGDGDPTVLAFLLIKSRFAKLGWASWCFPQAHNPRKTPLRWADGIEISRVGWESIFSFGYQADLWFARRWVAMTRYMDVDHWEWRTLLTTYAGALGRGHVGSVPYSMAIMATPQSAREDGLAVDLTFVLGSQCHELPPILERTELSVRMSAQQPVAKRSVPKYW